MFSRKNATSAARPPRDVIKQGYWVLRTTDPADPSGPVLDPATGVLYGTLSDVVPARWSEAFRGEYIPGAQRVKNRRARVEVFPHEIVLVDPSRRAVMLDGRGRPAKGSVSAQTCIPAWITPA